MRMMITLKKKSYPGQFAIPCTVKDIETQEHQSASYLGLWQTIWVCRWSLRMNCSLLWIVPRGTHEELAFLSTVGEVCNLQTNQLCLTLIDLNAHYDPIQVKTPQTISRRINDPGIIAACHCGAEYETEYSASVETHTATSIDSGHQAFLSTVGAVCNLQTNQLCLTLIDLNAHYDPIQVKTPQTISRRINDPGIIAACHCGAEYETEYSASVETHTATSIDSGHQAFLSTVGALCNLQTNQLCLTLIDPNAHYDPIPVKKPQTISRRINDPGMIAACHCGTEYETDYSASIETHSATSIDNEYDEDYEEERATEYRVILDGEEKLLHNSSWKRNAPSIDMTRSPSIDTQPHQRNRKRASTDTAYYKSIDTKVNHVREGDYSIGSWVDGHHHESFAVETSIYAPGENKLQDGFTDEELLNMQRRDETDQIQAEAAWERTRFSHPIDRAIHPSIDTRRPQSIDINNTMSIDNRSIPITTVK
ncbi:hypothetical protein F2Q68_00004525 [Brassica cretica]|uniref:Uncharacterized protein n=1 Tax=Brassica cretica TaxID=69181 RepID=A0A8S9J8U0_BRACR|nr:hypothetical protein F2Q68_00004525 [Brassica cretica]